MASDPVIQQLVQWAEGEPAIRALLLTSSRANPYALLDALSDYDALLTVADVQQFCEDKSYLDRFGAVLVAYHDPLSARDGFETCADVTQYETGLKIDFRFVSAAWLAWLSEQPQLPPDLELGYEVMLDKDGLATGLKPPGHQAYIPTPPTAQEYRDAVELFFHEATYVAKYLWRDDLMAAKHMLDHLQVDHLRILLEWQAEIEHGWSVRAGDYGRGLKRWLRPEVWTALEQTYVGPDLAQNWDALWRTIDLMRSAALEVGAHLGFAYPEALHARAVAYLRKVQALDRDNTTALPPGSVAEG